MNQLMIRGHTPHGHLDDAYSVSDLRKPRPLYNFSLLDTKTCEEQRLNERRRLAAAADAAGASLVSPVDPLLVACTEFATVGSHNNSAAGARILAQQRQLRRKSVQHASNQELMETHLRQTYGNELFGSGRYVVKGRVGIAGLPTSPIISGSSFQAMRSRILGPLPSGTFGGDDSDSDTELDNWHSSGSVFEWCDRNNSAEDVAKTCARRAGAKIAMRRGLSKWIFLYFRVRRVSWEFMVYEEKMNCSTVDLFSDNVLDRWTVKLRFKMLLDAPMKYPLMSFLARMGLDTDPDIVFSIDGFFGDMLVGGLRNKNSIPHRQVSFNTTPEAMGLQNGDNIFVVKANSTLRNNVEAHMEMAKRRANKTDGDEEEEEDEEVDEEEEEHH